MREFPRSAHEVRQLASDLIKFLKSNMENTHGRQKWTFHNIDLLQTFFGKEGLGVDFFPNDAEGEFLWDFGAYIEEHGLLLVAESEWDNKERDNTFPELEKDFDKLLYARSPLKLFMCWIKHPEMAESICARLQKNIEKNCTYYSPGEVFIIYCVWWAEQNGKNRDIAYILQIDGEPKYQPIIGERFKVVAE